MKNMSGFPLLWLGSLVNEVLLLGEVTATGTRRQATTASMFVRSLCTWPWCLRHAHLCPITGKWHGCHFKNNSLINDKDRMTANIYFFDVTWWRLAHSILFLPFENRTGWLVHKSNSLVFKCPAFRSSLYSKSEQETCSVFKCFW